MLLILFKGTLCSNIWKRWCLYSIRYVFGCLIFFFQKLLLVSILKQYTSKKKCLAQPNYVDKTKKNVLNDYKKSNVQFVHERQQARPRLHEFGHFSVVDPREGSSPLILSEARRAEENFFFDTAPPFPSPPPYLKVWIRHYFWNRKSFSLGFVWTGPLTSMESVHTKMQFRFAVSRSFVLAESRFAKQKMHKNET